MDMHATQCFSDKLIGYFYKDGVMPKSVHKPAIKTRNGWREVQVGKHYIITGYDGDRFVVDKNALISTPKNFQKQFMKMEWILGAQIDGAPFLRQKMSVNNSAIT